MKKQIFLRWLWCVLEYLMYFPLGLTVAGLILPYKTVVTLLPLLPVHLFFGLALTAVLKRFKNYVAVFIGIIYVTAVVFIFKTVILTGLVKETIAVAVTTVFFYIWGIAAGTRDITNRIFLYSGGLVIHIISLFIINNIETLKPYFAMAMWVSIIYCLFGFPLANRRFLINETYEKSSLKTIPASVNRGNGIIVSVLLSGIIVLSFWRVLLDAFIYIARSIAWIILKIIEFMGSLYQPVEEGGGGAPQDMMVLPPAEEQNSVAEILFYVITALLFAGILFLVIRYLVKNYRRICHALYKMLSAFFSRFQKWSTTEQGYFDREESLLKTEFQRRARTFGKLFRRHPKWRDMKDNESRVRFIYTKFVMDYIRKGLKVSLANTPAEVADKARKFDKGEKDHSLLRDVYNNVRYGDKKVDDETVRILKDRYL